MKKFYKVMSKVNSALLAFIACGALCNNLGLIIDFEWWETILCFVLAIVVRKFPDILDGGSTQ